MTPQQLKDSILQLAVEGKLVPQIESEGNAEDLYNQIQKEKSQLIKEGKIKKEKPLDPITDDEIPFEIPQSWKWVRLGDVSKPMSDGVHFAPKYIEKGIYCFSAKDIFDGKINTEKAVCITQKDYDEMRNKIDVSKGCILITKSGSIGRTAIVDVDYIFGLVESIGVVKPISLYSKYIKKCLDFYFEGTSKYISTYTKGTTIKHLTLTLLSTILIPLPPLSEQKRIVDKIEELLPLVDKYGEAYNQLSELEEKFPSDLKKSILQYAMEGKLVPQIESEGTAEDLYQQIQKEKALKIKNGEIKKEKPLDPITDDEIPFEIPQSWKWIRLGDAVILQMGQSPEGETINNLSKGIEFHQSKIFFGEKELLHSDTFTTKPTKISESDSVLLCVRAPVGNVNIVKWPICIGRGLSEVRPLCGMTSLFLFYCLNTLKKDFESKATGSTFKAITNDVIKNQLMPLPPLSEQKRIVDKIEELFSVIDSQKN